MVPGYKTPFTGNLIGTQVRQRERDGEEGRANEPMGEQLLASFLQRAASVCVLRVVDI